MSNTQDGFLGKVSKGIKKRIFDDEPEEASDSALIGRLQSLSNTESMSQSEKDVDPSPPLVTGNIATEELAAAQEPAHNQYNDAAYADSSSVPGSKPVETSESLATILVVEDDLVTRRLLKKILEDRGYEVVVCEDGVEALMALGKMTFDLILCDINMPNMNGFTLLEFLNQKNILIPVIFVTVREDVEDEITGLALGAKDYVRKPINRDLLLLRIRKALDR